MKADPETEARVLEVIRASWDAYANKDLEQFMSFYVDDPDLAAIGTGADERYVGPAELRMGILRDFCQPQSATLDFTWWTVSSAGDVAWVAADCVATAEAAACRQISVPCRLTAVLERREGRWRIAHTHFSVGSGSQPRGMSYPQGL